jgi:hypothetical protein
MMYGVAMGTHFLPFFLSHIHLLSASFLSHKLMLWTLASNLHSTIVFWEINQFKRLFTYLTGKTQRKATGSCTGSLRVFQDCVKVITQYWLLGRSAALGFLLSALSLCLYFPRLRALVISNLEADDHHE